MKCERKVSLEKGTEEYRFEANANSGRNTIETEHNANEWRKEQCLKERNTLVFQEVKYKHTHRRFNSLPTNTHIHVNGKYNGKCQGNDFPTVRPSQNEFELKAYYVKHNNQQQNAFGQWDFFAVLFVLFKATAQHCALIERTKKMK